MDCKRVVLILILNKINHAYKLILSLQAKRRQYNFSNENIMFSTSSVYYDDTDYNNSQLKPLRDGGGCFKCRINIFSTLFVSVVCNSRGCSSKGYVLNTLTCFIL